ncbi:MAG: hypothetical protein ABEH78_06950 [Haloferacaceae archaeon]
MVEIRDGDHDDVGNLVPGRVERRTVRLQLLDVVFFAGRILAKCDQWLVSGLSKEGNTGLRTLPSVYKER